MKLIRGPTKITGNAVDWVYTYTVDPPIGNIAPDDGSIVSCIADAQIVPTPPSVNNSCGDPLQ